MINRDKIFINEMRSGLFSVLPEKLIINFNSDEFELMLNGYPFIDVEDWRANTTYKNSFSEKHKVIKWFWEIIQSYEQSDLRNILRFCTGTTRVPLGGFS